MTLLWNFLKGGGWIMVVAGTVLAAGFGWHYQQVKRAEARGRILELTAQVDSIYQLRAADSLANRLAKQRSDSIIGSLRAELKDQTYIIDHWQNRAASASQRVRELLEDNGPNAAIILATIDTLERANEECMSGLVLCEAITDSMSTQLVIAARRAAEDEDLIQRQRVVIEGLERPTGGTSWFPWLVAGGSAVIALLAVLAW